MKHLICLLFCIISTAFVYSQEAPFRYEWVNTDFNGVAYNDKAVVAYGDHGIITYSTDRGITWRQTNIGAKHSIKNIIKINNIFYGVSDNSIFKSEDGAVWNVLFEEQNDKLIDITNIGNSIYLLKKDGIYFWNLGEDIQFIKIAGMDNTYRYKEMESDGNNLFILKENYEIIIYNIESNNFTTYTIPNVNPNVNVRIKVLNDNIYYYFDEIKHFGNVFGQLHKSEDGGKNFELINYQRSSAYFEYDTVIYALEAYIITDSLGRIWTYLMQPHLLRYDKLKQPVSLTEFEAPDRKITSQPANSFIEIAKIDKDTLIGVGKNKLIAISFNAGKNWKICSFIDTKEEETGERYIMGSYINDSLQYLTDAYSCITYKSSNSGATWIPQKFNPYANFEYKYKENLSYGRIKNYYYNNKGEGFLRFQTSFSQDTNFAVTTDYGETYIYAGTKLYPPNNAYILNREALEMKNHLIYSYYYYENKEYVFEIARFDKDHNFIDHIKFYEEHNISLKKINENKLLLVTLIFEGKNLDTTGEFQNFKYEYQIMESNDEGATWKKIEIKVPLYLKKHYWDSDGYYTMISNLYNTFLLDEHLIFLSGDNTYIYDITENKFDSLNIVLKTDNRLGTAFKIDSTYYIACSTNSDEKQYLYYSNNLFVENPSIDSIEYNSAFIPEGYKILESRRIGNIVYLYVGKAYKGNYTYSYRMNYIKIYDEKSTSAAENEITFKYYLQASRPYPNPGRNTIYMEIFWTNDLADEIPSFDVYDYLGNKVYADILFDRTSNNTGIITLKPGGLPKGVYMVLVKFPSKQKSVQVVVE